MTDKAEKCECEGIRVEVKRAPKGVTINLDCCGDEEGSGRAVGRGLWTDRPDHDKDYPEIAVRSAEELRRMLEQAR